MKSTVNGYAGSRSTDGGTYASPEDFCAVFIENMDSLYSLALVLTANHETAQQCFIAALDECRAGGGVFREWTRPWSRRAIIKSAIRLAGVALKNNGAPGDGQEAIAEEINASARFLMELRTLDRFVFVISVLERYKLRECAVLLSLSSREVEEARVRALQYIAGNSRNLAPAPYGGSSHSAESSVFTLHQVEIHNVRTSLIR